MIARRHLNCLTPISNWLHLTVCSGTICALYFYPRDDAPGCTTEALKFSELEMDFRDKHGFSVQLLSDVEGEVCRRYGVLEQKEYESQRRECIRRSTFVIDRRSVVRHALYGVSPRGHAAEVLQLIKEI